MPPRRKMMRLELPFKGLHEGFALEDQPPGTTSSALNVRGRDVKTGRQGMTVRPGLTDFCSAASSSVFPGGGAIQNISILSTSEPQPHIVGEEAVTLQPNGSFRLLDITADPPAALADTTGPSGQFLQFSFWDRDGNFYAVLLNNTAIASGNDAGYYQIKSYRRSRSGTSTIYDTVDTGWPKTFDEHLASPESGDGGSNPGLQVVGHACSGDHIWTWWANRVTKFVGESPTYEEKVTKQRVSDFAFVNAVGAVTDESYFYAILTSEDDFKISSNAAEVSSSNRNLMTIDAGYLYLLSGTDGAAGTSLYAFAESTGSKISTIAIPETEASSSANVSSRVRIQAVSDKHRSYSLTRYRDTITTALNGAHADDVLNLTVDSTAGMSVGEAVVITDGGVTERNLIADVNSATELGLSRATSSAYGDDSVVEVKTERYRLQAHGHPYSGALSSEWGITLSGIEGSHPAKLTSMSLEEWGASGSILYVSGGLLENSSWLSASGSAYDPTDASHAGDNLVAINGADGKILDGGRIGKKWVIKGASGQGSGSGSLQIELDGYEFDDSGAVEPIADGTAVFISGMEAEGAGSNTDGVCYVKNSGTDKAKLFTGPDLINRHGDAGPTVGGYSTFVEDAGTGIMQEVDATQSVKAMVGLSEYSGTYGNAVISYDRTYNTLCVVPDLLKDLRLAADPDGTINTKSPGTRFILNTPTGAGAVAVDKSRCLEVHAADAKDSRDILSNRGVHVFASSGGQGRLVLPKGGPVDIALSGETSGFSAAPAQFFSTPYSKFVSGANLYGPWSLFCDGYQYKVAEASPYKIGFRSWPASAGSLPTGSDGRAARLVENWRGRVVLSGIADDPTNWFMSALGDPTDWNYFPSVTVETQAVAGNNTSAGKCPDVINTIIPYSDDLLLFGGDKSIWQMTGDPMSGGRMDLLSSGGGMSFGRPWAKDPSGRLFFFGSRGGVYVMIPSQRMPEKISGGSLDERLRNVNLQTNTILLEWSDEEDGLYIFVCPRTPAGDASSTNSVAYFWDSKTNAWWPDSFAYAKQPMCTAVSDGDAPGDRKMLLGGRDGKVYILDEDSSTDDGESVFAHVLVGPIASRTGNLMCLEELQIIVSENSDGAKFTVYVGDTEPARETIQGVPAFGGSGTSSDAGLNGTATAGANNTFRRRAVGRNIWAVFSNGVGEKFVVDAVNIYARELGRASSRRTRT